MPALICILERHCAWIGRNLIIADTELSANAVLFGETAMLVVAMDRHCDVCRADHRPGGKQ